MLELIRKTIADIPTREGRVHRAREFLQLLVLKILYDKGYYKHIAFVGGTALRVLYDLKRFSEDLDFSVIRKEGYDFKHLLKGVVYQLVKSGFSLDVKEQEQKTAQSAMLKFKDILFELGLSKMKDEKLSIRLEIDSTPPRGWHTEISLVNKDFIFTVTHFDLPSLYATKLHACFFRKYVKGRDFYDLVWYIEKKILPNFPLLNNAIRQTEKEHLSVNEENFNAFLVEKLSEIDFVKVKRDVERFLLDKNELNLLNKSFIINLLNKW